MVGGQDGEDRIGISFRQDGRGEAHRIEGVSAARFAQHMVIGHRWNHLIHLFLESFGGTDPLLAVPNHTGEPIACKAEQASTLDQRDELLGTIRSAHWPESGAGSASHDHCVSHGSL